MEDFGRPPRSQHMTGLDQERVDWLHEQLAVMVEWNASTGRPRVMPLYTAIVMVLFALRHNLPPDVLGELFGCGSTTVGRYQDELEILIDTVLSPLFGQVRDRARRDPVLVDGLLAPVGEREAVDGLLSDKKKYSGINVQVVATLSGRLANVSGCQARQSGVPGVWDRPAVGRALRTWRQGDDRGQRVPRDRDYQPVQEACRTAEAISMALPGCFVFLTLV